MERRAPFLHPGRAPPRLDPRAPDRYTAEDALAVGNLLIRLLRNSDRVAIACQAILVNVVAPIRTEPGRPAWRQATYHPFALTARHARGDVLRVEPVCDTVLDTATRGDVAPVDLIATRADDGGMTLFVVNRAADEAATARVTIRAGGDHRVVEHLAIDSRAAPADDGTTPLGVPANSDAHELTDRNVVEVRLPPASWHMIRLSEVAPG